MASAVRLLRHRTVDTTNRRRRVGKWTQTKQAAGRETLVFSSGNVRVFVGSVMNAWWPSHNFDVVLNCCVEWQDDSNPEIPGYYYRFPLLDNNDCQIETHVAKLATVVEGCATQTKDDGRPLDILIHCVWGCSRSVAIAVLFISLYQTQMELPLQTCGELVASIVERRGAVDMSVALTDDVSQVLDRLHGVCARPETVEAIAVPSEC
jgi:hypothetical protein